MVDTKVLLLGATGETGSSILEGLIEHGNYDISLYIREQSLKNTAVIALRTRGLNIVSAPSSPSVTDLVDCLTGIDVVVSAVGPAAQFEQLKWIDAAKLAGVKRFVPCGFTTICPRGDVMRIRDEKELVHDHLFRQRVPYTIIDVGYWYQLSLFPLPSCKLDYAIAMPSTEVYGDGTAKNLLIDKADIGRYVARIVADPRTLNHKVAAYGSELSQNEIREITERVSGETLSLTHVPTAELVKRKDDAITACGDSTDWSDLMPVIINQYIHSKYVRQDNTSENAEYLGYLDAKKLYSDFVATSFKDYLQAALEGTATQPYANLRTTLESYSKSAKAC